MKNPAVNDRLGIEIVAPTDVALTGITVRNCIVAGFLNNVRVRRDGFKLLAEGHEYDHVFSDIRIENSRFYDSTGSGIFVDGYVTGVTLSGIEIARSGGVGVYLEAGSKDNVVEDSAIHHNGYKDTGPEGVPIVVGGQEFRYQYTGREGIAIDGSRDNVIRNNSIHDNSAGGIFLYKNCGEYATTEPDGWWTRRYGATGNLIEGNDIGSEETGVWVASRAAENQEFMDCSDTPYVSAPLRRIYRDPASDNVVRGNTFADVTYGVRVEDDRNRVEDNVFYSSLSGFQAVIVGTSERTAVLGEPVTDTTVTGNASWSPASPTPFGWIHGHAGTVFAGNEANAAAVGLVAGTQPPINPFLFAESVWLVP
jgi:parallel beta-helix repeat protein